MKKLLSEFKNSNEERQLVQTTPPPHCSKMVGLLTRFISRIWAEERIPSSWGASLIITIYKKGPRSECSNHRGISLVPVVTKLLTSLLLHRLMPYRETNIHELAAVFRPCRGCIDQIFTLRQVLEQRHIY